MKLKANYLVIPLVVFGAGFLGTLFTTPNLTSWYQTLALPSFAPAGSVIGTVWTVLYVLIALAVIFYWNKTTHTKEITGLLLANGFLNAFWSYVFFSLHQIGWATLVSAAMAVTIYALVYLLWNKYRTAAYLLIPYGVWVTFATYLNYVIWTLNR